MSKIVIDTRLWALGLKVSFLAKHDPAIQYATTAQAFLRKMMKEQNHLLFSSHLVSEIYDSLTQTGNAIPADQANSFLSELLARKDSIYRPVSEASLLRCTQLSAVSGIHIWDYLVAFPFEDAIDVIYTIDPHFQHASFQELGRIENPLGIWKTEDEPL